jgi:tetratricopeptide (TPR) repeat protein
MSPGVSMTRGLLLVGVLLLVAGTIGAWWLRQREAAPAVASEVPAEPEAIPFEGRHPLFPEPQAAPAPEIAPAPRSPTSEKNERATHLLAEGKLEDAVALFEQCLAAEPTREVFAGNLAEALVRLARAEHDRGALAAAVEHLARAIELAPAREDVATLQKILERWKRELELGADDWTEGSSRFELSFDTTRSDILHHSHEVLEHLEESYDDLRGWFQADPFASSARARGALRFEGVRSPHGLGDWAGGVFDGVVRVSVDDLLAGDAWRSVLVHELVHAFVQATAGAGVPGWLNEGLAQLLENRPGVVERLRAGLDAASVFPLERLKGTLASWDDTAAIGRAYAESLVFVAHLRANFGDEALRRMLAGVADGRTVDEAFQAWTSVSLAVAFEDWRATLP